MAARCALELEYLALGDCHGQRRRGVLGGARFDRAPEAASGGGEDLGFPLATVRTPVLGPARERLELWSIGEDVRSGARGCVRYTSSRDFLFGIVSLHEDEAPPEGAGRTRLHATASRAYREIFATLAAAGHPHLLRVWNFLPEINLETHGLERYRQFNCARQEALIACGRSVAGAVPAASALGSASGSPLVIYFLASRLAPAVIENPRQVSAYRYPEEYGPKSPAFSRAAAVGSKDAATLFISGTSSIVGHRTVHAGDAAAQTRESLTNIEAVLEEAGRVALAGKPRLESLAYKVYVRDPEELALIRGALEAAVGGNARVLYLQADICRRDLAVEIEAVWGPGLKPGN
jgi:enamine deaminase RidA (YjgF/YER057c/UK114 family)